ncbi:T9SS type A sorting domain-containing protein [Aureispira anguillae]|uniref:T9SS type A sorting domain-containing protein n=1 Tax=Aureispira anguillae TaxID=2864201 RepID=A0A915YCE4_9BACT|nr:T9SS type A sorting domain-containing protein [Aureispira anguillae]BDS10502.1 T9SS type A sorting domain-containing protein [Aureispira anguillae]
MRLSALVIACFFAVGTTNAQTKVWGVGSGTGVAEAEFQNNFVQAGTFAAGDNATAWTALSINQSTGAVTPGAAYWTRNLTGYSQGAYWSGTTPVASPSQANGVAIFDSDFLDNGGVAGAFGTGTAPTDHRGELISPRIDLSGYMDSALVIQFYALYRDFQIGELSVAVSVDDGQTWAATEDFRSAIPDLTQGNARVLFAGVTAGVANLSQCRIKFVFDGNYYFALVDDVTIEVAPTYDISMGGPEPGVNTLTGSGDNAKIGGNRYNALDNIVHANDLREWFWGGKVTNFGAVDIVPQDSAAMYVSIDFTDAVTGATTAGVYLDTVYMDSTIKAGDAAGVTELNYLKDIAFINTHGAGDYTVTYWASHKNADGNNNNDTTRHVFTITDGGGALGNYMSKVRVDATDGGVRATSGTFPGGGPFSAWEFGSVFFFPRGASDTVSIDSVSFRYRLTNGFSGAATQTLFCNIYQMDASASYRLNDAALLTQVGVAPVTLSGLGSTVAAGDYGLTTISGFVDASSGGAMAPLVDNGFYYVSILTSPSLTGGSATFDSDDVPWYGSEDGSNYYMNAAMTRVDSVINPSPLSVTDNAGTATWYWTGFSSGSIPSLGLFLGVKPVNPVSVSTVWETEGANLSVYPNPAREVLNIHFTLEEADDVMYIVTDVAGRVINVTESGNVTNDTYVLDVSNLPAGVYMVTAKTSKGTSSTERFIVK